MLINILAVIGGLTLLGCLITVIILAPETYRILRNHYAGQWPFDYPVWYYRARKHVRRFWARYSDDLFGVYLISTVIIALLIHWIS